MNFVKVCRSLELFGRELIAVDGTRIKAVNSRDRSFIGAKLRRDLAASQERLVRYLQQMDEMDAADMADASTQQGAGAGSGTEDYGAARAPCASRNAP